MADNAKSSKNGRKKQGRIILFVIELLVLAAMVSILWLVVKGTGEDGVQKAVISPVDVGIPEDDDEQDPEEVEAAKAMEGYWNIALFGVDSTNQNLFSGNNRTDTIIIASINKDTKEVKLVSIYRDTLFNITNMKDEQVKDTLNKANAAYSFGGAEQALRMLNLNLGLQIKDFVTVGFKGLADTVDALGGLQVEIMEDEIKHLNNYQQSMAKDLEREDYVKIANPGMQLLDGMQATAYCRIRYTDGEDFKRAERQRLIVELIVEKAKTSSAATLTEVVNQMIQQVYTSINVEDVLKLVGEVGEYEIVESIGFPSEEDRKIVTISGIGSCIVPLNLEQSVADLHAFLFENESYVPGEYVVRFSDAIKAEAAPYLED